MPLKTKYWLIRSWSNPGHVLHSSSSILMLKWLLSTYFQHVSLQQKWILAAYFEKRFFQKMLLRGLNDWNNSFIQCFRNASKKMSRKRVYTTFSKCLFSIFAKTAWGAFLKRSSPPAFLFSPPAHSSRVFSAAFLFFSSCSLLPRLFSGVCCWILGFFEVSSSPSEEGMHTHRLSVLCVPFLKQLTPKKTKEWGGGFAFSLHSVETLNFPFPPVKSLAFPFSPSVPIILLLCFKSRLYYI